MPGFRDRLRTQKERELFSPITGDHDEGWVGLYPGDWMFYGGL